MHSCRKTIAFIREMLENGYKVQNNRLKENNSTFFVLFVSGIWIFVIKI